MNLKWIYPATGDEVEVTQVTPIIQNGVIAGYDVEFLNPYPDGDTFLRAKVKEFPLYELANLRQRNEDTEALLIIARAERDTARATQEQLQGVVTAQEAEIARLRATLENIAFNAPQEELTSLTMRALGQAKGFYYAGVFAKKALGNE